MGKWNANAKAQAEKNMQNSAVIVSLETGVDSTSGMICEQDAPSKATGSTTRRPDLPRGVVVF